MDAEARTLLAANVAEAIEANPELDPAEIYAYEAYILALDAAEESPTVVNIVRVVRWSEACFALFHGTEYDAPSRGFDWTAPWGQTFGMSPCDGGWAVSDSLGARCGFKPQTFAERHQAAAWLARQIDAAIRVDGPYSYTG